MSNPNDTMWNLCLFLLLINVNIALVFFMFMKMTCSCSFLLRTLIRVLYLFKILLSHKRLKLQCEGQKCDVNGGFPVGSMFSVTFSSFSSIFPSTNTSGQWVIDKPPSLICSVLVPSGSRSIDPWSIVKLLIDGKCQGLWTPTCPYLLWHDFHSLHYYRHVTTFS